MSLRPLQEYLVRSFQVFKESFQHPDIRKLDMFQFKSESDLQRFIVGSDADMGGLSKAYWAHTPQNTGLFYGSLNQSVPNQSSKIDLSGYAGIRSKLLPPALFFSRTFDVSIYRYLVIRAKGDHNEWSVNIQTISYSPTVLWQYPLKFQSPGEWETIYIPFTDFVRHDKGVLKKMHLPMNRDELRTVGFSIMRQNCDFSLELDWIASMNTETSIGDYD